MKSELEILEDILKDAGKEIMRFYRESDLHILHKSDDSLVTEADLASEKSIISAINRQFPNDKIFSEESGLSSIDRTVGSYIWIIDPLDGTSNFANHYPFFCISIARGEFMADGRIKIVLGGIHDPLREECFLAKRGGGATCNGRPIQIRPDRPPELAFIVTGFSYHKGPELRKDVERFLSVADRCQSIRRDGAAALDLAYVAKGVYDGYWEFGLKPWDIAAGSLIVTEAGGEVYNPSQIDSVFNTESEGILCGTSSITRYLLEKM